MGKKGKIAVYLTPNQIAAAEEAADHYVNYDLDQGGGAPGQLRSTQTAASALRRAFTDTGEPWPW